ncbi:hypothetical protein ACP70R_033114 [Stipagrostis hirtigluma subsp. patula]
MRATDPAAPPDTKASIADEEIGHGSLNGHWPCNGVLEEVPTVEIRKRKSRFSKVPLRTGNK